MTKADFERLSERTRAYEQTQEIRSKVFFDKSIDGYLVRISYLTEQQAHKFKEQVDKMIAEEQAAALAEYETELSKWGSQK